MVEREGRRRRTRMRWTVLGSTWTHLVLLLAVQCTHSEHSDDDDSPTLQLMAIQALPAPTSRSVIDDDAGSALDALSERAKAVRSDAERALREVETLAAAVPTQVSESDLGLRAAHLDALDAALASTAPLADQTLAALQLAESDVSAAIEELQALSIAADALSLQSAALDDTHLAQIDSQRLTAPAVALDALVTDALEVLDRRADDSVGLAEPSERAPTDGPAPVEDDAVADATPADEREVPDPIEEDVPKPPPPPPAGDVLMQKFVHSDSEVLPDSPEVAEYISSVDADDDEVRRRAVTAEAEGAQTLWQEGQRATPAAPQVRTDEGEPNNPMGEPDAVQATEVVEERPEGGGRRGESDGRGADGDAGDQRDGGAAAAEALKTEPTETSVGEGQTPAPGRTGVAAVAGASGTPMTGADGVAEAAAPNADSAADGTESGWWRPMAARVVLPARPSTPPATAPAAAVASPTESDGISELQRPEDRADQGGAQSEDDTPASPTEAEQPDDTPGEVEEHTPAADPIADLRADLGWGGIDREQLAPRATPSGQAGMQGMTPTSRQRVLDPTIDADTVSYIQARGTEVGEYTEQLYDEVQKAWYDLDLSDDEKAQGIQGDVTLLFHIQRNGRVRDLTVLRSSGHAVLDEMARAAVPSRLPRIPREIESDMLLQQITFHYRNPLVSTPLPALQRD